MSDEDVIRFPAKINPPALIRPQSRELTPLRETRDQRLERQIDERRPPPVNVECEQALLGAIFVNNAAFEHVVDIVKPEEFGNDVHARIFEAIGKLIEQGQTANPVSLRNYFDNDAALVDIGGAQYLVRLAHSAVTTANAPDYAKRVHDLYLRRELMALGQDIVDRAYKVDVSTTAVDHIESAEQRIHEIANLTTRGQGPKLLGDLSNGVLASIQDAFQGEKPQLVDTGLLDIDRIVRGMGPGYFVTIAGRTSMGKTSLGLGISHHASSQGRVGIYFSLEMSREELTQRFLARETGISTDRQRHAEIQADIEWSRLADASTYLQSLPLFIDDQTRLSVAQIRQRARRIKRRYGLHYIVIDNLQLVRPSGTQTRRNDVVGDNAGLFKAVAKELGITVIALSQLSRAVEQRDDKRPMLSDLKESGDIEDDSDLVMLMFREEYYLQRNPPRRRENQTKEAYTAKLADWEERLSQVRGIAEINIAKNRHGRVGPVKVHFDGESHSFDNLAYDHTV